MKSVKIVIADDHQLILQGYFSIFEMHNKLKVVGSVRNGKDLIDLLRKRKNTVDIILLDYHMPVMNGLEALSIIKKEFQKIRVIMVSMESSRAFIQHCLIKGADSYYVKGDDIELLIKLIHELSLKNKELIKSNSKNTSEIILTPIERKIVSLIHAGLMYKEIACKLHRSIETIKFHRSKIKKKTGCRNNAELAIFAERNNFTLVNQSKLF